MNVCMFCAASDTVAYGSQERFPQGVLEVIVLTYMTILTIEESNEASFYTPNKCENAHAVAIGRDIRHQVIPIG